MDRSDGTSTAGRRGARRAVGLIAVLVLAIVAGVLVLGGDRFALKPATGSAQAMAAASDRAR